MTKEMTFRRLLPLALALMLIGLTAIWGTWLGTRAQGTGHWPFALSAALWPLLAWAGCHSRQCSRRGARANLIRAQLARPTHAMALRFRAGQSSAFIVTAPPLPEAQREPARERGPEFAGAFKR